MVHVQDGDDIYNHYINDDRVSVLYVLDDINQPFSCSMWNNFGSPGGPPIIDDGANYYLSELFACTLCGYPKNVFIDHEMKVHSIVESDLVFSDAQSRIDEMLETMCAQVDCNGTLDVLSFFPNDFSISSVYPNPFNPLVNIEFSLNASMVTSIDVVDINGNHIQQLSNSFLSAGNHSIIWDGSSNSSGVYFISISNGESKISKKIILMK
tara:strand:+ start:237 stop:866 length:630 start_codon:yes stop_codon:yes gene_type:complete